MSIYAERIAQDEASIRERIDGVATSVLRALQGAVRALLTGDRALANATVLGDMAINREIREIDHLCLQFVARHLPSAGHLRFVTAVRRLTIELERVGDYAATIGRAAAYLSAKPPVTVLRDVELMADNAERVLSESIQAFLERNAERARGIRILGDQMASTYHRALVDLIRSAEAGDVSIPDLLALQAVLSRLDRVGDQAKNVCEEAIFAATGETKPAKVYRILFVDARHGMASRLAEALARRDYPHVGRYRSAGWDPSGEPSVSPACEAFFAEHGLPATSPVAERLIPLWDELSDYHIIVSLEGELRQHVPEVPFDTVQLEWDLGASTSAAEAEPDSAALEALLERLSQRLRALSVELRGAEAVT